MNFRRGRYRAWIVPYAEGTLDARRRARLEAWLARDPVLAAEAEAERRVVTRLREAARESAGSAPGENNLWPGIQSRLEPRRSLVRPLILVGGLSAAATSLAWATLWGPLGHPVPSPPVVVVSNPVAPSVIVVRMPPGHRPRPRPRHGSGSLVKRPAARPDVEGAPVKSGAPEDSLLARHDVPPFAAGGEQTPAPPRFAPRGGTPLHLAASVHPASRSGSPDGLPPAADGGSTDGGSTEGDVNAADFAANGVPVAVGASGDTQATDGTADATTSTTAGQAETNRTSLGSRNRRHRRRRARHTRPTKSPVNTPSSVAAPDESSPVSRTDTHPKAGSKPVD